LILEQCSISQKKIIVYKKLKMKRSKLKQIKNHFFKKKNMVSTLPFVFCFWSSTSFKKKKLIFQCCVNWNLKLVILYEHLELNKKPHHWFGARLYKKRNWLYCLRKNKYQKIKIETWKKIKIGGLKKTNCVNASMPCNFDKSSFW
jgi:hypothetical protein